MKPIILSNPFAVTLFICLSVKYASSLNCYDCDSYHSSSDVHTACRKLDPTMITKCPDSEKPVCRILKAENSVSGIAYIKRSCSTLMFENIEEFEDPQKNKLLFKEGVPVTSMICNTDLCNGSVAVGDPSTKLILFITAILVLSIFL